MYQKVSKSSRIAVVGNTFKSGPVRDSQKRPAPSSSASSNRSTTEVVNLAELSPPTLHRIDKAAKIAEKKAPAIAAETSRRGKARYHAELAAAAAKEKARPRSSQSSSVDQVYMGIVIFIYS